MPFHMYRHPTQFAQFITLIVFTPLGIAATVLRFVATRRSGRKADREDWLAAVAAFFFVACNFGALMSITVLNGRAISHLAYDSPHEYKHARKVCQHPPNHAIGHCLTRPLPSVEHARPLHVLYPRPHL
jgi:hypothetical protein